MQYIQFMEAVRDRIAKELGEDHEVTLRKVRKNNGVLLDGLLIQRAGEPVAPNLYLNQWKGRQLDEESAREAAASLVRQYRAVRPQDLEEIRQQLTPEGVCERVEYRIINKSRNRTLLREAPHRSFLDLALVYYCRVCTESFGEGSMLVRSEHLDGWGLTAEDLDRAAARNTPRLHPTVFQPLSAMLREYSAACAAEEEDEAENPSCLHVLTNRERMYGAVYLADRAVLRDAAHALGDDLYLLPSSIHECMVLTAACCTDVEYLGSLVRDINRTEVSEEEFLSDSIYRFSRETGEVEIAA